MWCADALRAGGARICHVLVIEDDCLIADHISHLLETAGATSIEIAVTQAGALAAAHANLPDLITSDVQLVEGSGPLAVQAIIAAFGPIPVIYVTGTPEACHPRAAGMAVLGKPVDEPVLAATFRRMVPLATG